MFSNSCLRGVAVRAPTVEAPAARGDAERGWGAPAAPPAPPAQAAAARGAGAGAGGRALLAAAGRLVDGGRLGRGAACCARSSLKASGVARLHGRHEIVSHVYVVGLDLLRCGGATALVHVRQRVGDLYQLATAGRYTPGCASGGRLRRATGARADGCGSGQGGGACAGRPGSSERRQAAGVAGRQARPLTGRPLEWGRCGACSARRCSPPPPCRTSCWPCCVRSDTAA